MTTITEGDLLHMKRERPLSDGPAPGGLRHALLLRHRLRAMQAASRRLERLALADDTTPAELSEAHFNWMKKRAVYLQARAVRLIQRPGGSK